jgi:hypothetical protein
MSAFQNLTTLLLLLSLVQPGKAAILTYGSEVEVRLLHKVGSRVSHVGDPVEASVITPVFDKNQLLLEAGATVSGSVEHINRLGLGLRHPTARLDIHFTSLKLKSGVRLPMDAHVVSVETARESVRTDGAIMGINPTANFSTGVSAIFSLTLLGEPEIRLPVLGFKFLAARSPDAEILLPAGTEMLLRVTSNVELQPPAHQNSDVPLLPAVEIATVQQTLGRLPAQQTDRGPNHPSDLVNIMIIGSRAEITRSFRAAGWMAPESHGVMALYHMFHCAVERKSYSHLPMSNLLLNGAKPDEAFEKSLDTFSKRHHVRLWHDDAAGVWLGAATEDVGYKREAMHLTHRTDRRIDNERAKVVNDLAFTGCVDKGALIPRDSLKPVQDSGSSIATDGDIAVLQLNACENPHAMPVDNQAPVPMRAIRVAIAVGDDIARSNPVSVAYSMMRSMLEAHNVRSNERLQAARFYMRPSAIASATSAMADGSLAAR